MAERQNDKNGYDFNTNRGTRMDSAAEGQTNNQQAEGGKNKGLSEEKKPASHQEGQYDKQSDDPTMRPSDIDENKSI